MALAALVALACGDGGLCQNSSHVEIRSPDDQLGAWIFIRTCRATTPDSVQVSILPAGSAAPSDGGNTFGLEGRGGVSVEWPGDRELLISHEDTGKIFQQELRVGDVAVSYRTE